MRPLEWKERVKNTRKCLQMPNTITARQLSLAALGTPIQFPSVGTWKPFRCIVKSSCCGGFIFRTLSALFPFSVGNWTCSVTIVTKTASTRYNWSENSENFAVIARIWFKLPFWLDKLKTEGILVAWVYAEQLKNCCRLFSVENQLMCSQYIIDFTIDFVDTASTWTISTTVNPIKWPRVLVE